MMMMMMMMIAMIINSCHDVSREYFKQNRMSGKVVYWNSEIVVFNL
jgi:hypothetical protein